MINDFTLCLLVVIAVICVYTANATTISCRSLLSWTWDEVGEQNTCDLSMSTGIDTDDVSFEGDPDVTIGALDLRTSSTVSFLPIDIDKKFPSLVLYQAGFGSIKTISKKNFKNLSHLRWLSLGDNQIVKIPNNAFEDLKNLEWIELHRNKIKFLNGFAFSGLIKLKSVGLNDNECINEYFGDREIATFSDVVTEKCGYNENETTTVRR